MKARTAIAWTAYRVRLTAVGWGLITTVLACVALSACTSSGTSSPPSLFSPTASGSSSVSGTPTSTASSATSATSTATSTATETSTGSPTETSTPTPTPTYSPTPSPTTYSPYPTAAPVTGGGGTAGFQDAGIAVLGGGAILAGLGSIAYRRRITRRR